MMLCLPIRLFVTAFVAVCLLPVAATEAGSQSGISTGPGYVARSWLREDGLPQNAVTSVIQTRDGYLWIGTYNGLARFDGVRFVTFNPANAPELPSSRITCLFEAKDGTLWIGDEAGRVTRLSGGVFQSVPLKTNALARISHIGQDTEGDIWLANNSGRLLRVRDGTILDPETGNLKGWVDFIHNPKGMLWILCDGRVSELRKGKLEPLPLKVGAENTYILGVGADRKDGLWIWADDRLGNWRQGKWVEARRVSGMAGVPAKLIELGNGAVAAATSDRGVILSSAKQPPISLNRAHGFPSDWTTGVSEDREGNLWMGTGGAGLVMVRESNLTTLTSPDKWQGRAVLSVLAEQDGGLWIGTEGAGLYHLKGDVWRNFSAREGLDNPYIWSVAEAGGTLWAGSWSGGLYKRQGDRFERARGTEQFVPVTALLPVGGRELLAGTGDGLMRHAIMGELSRYETNPNQSRNHVRCIVTNDAGAIWFGTSGNGLFELSRGNLRHFAKSNGLASDFIQCLRWDGDALWIGTADAGLSRLKGDLFSVINLSNGVPDNVICDIEDDGMGFFWFSSFNGIFRISKTELNACAERKIPSVTSIAYGISDGMPTLECSGGFQPAGGKLLDGRLLFPTSRGLVLVDPHRVKTNDLAPPVVIEELLVDGVTTMPRNAGSELAISPGWHQFEFLYTALSFVAPEQVRFKCRLEGLDPEWKPAEAKRSVTYNYLPPGSYRFRVIASNNNGVWNETGATLAFRVTPYFWQTAWFHTMSVTVLVLIASSSVWYATRRRMRLKLERLERHRALERERTRIAKDIHDDLGASLTRISLLSQSVQRAGGASTDSLQELEGIQETARRTVRALDEIVWAVDPQHDTFDSLVSYLAKLTQDMALAAGIGCRLEFPDQFPERPITAEFRHNLFLAVKEAINNVVKHSSASEMRLSLEVTPEELILKVEDNGRGFTPAAALEPKSVGPRRIPRSGLANMRFRLKEIGGNCEISGTPGKGTRVVFRIPLLK